MDSLKDLRSSVEKVCIDGDGYYTDEHERLQQLFHQQLKINEELVERLEKLEKYVNQMETTAQEIVEDWKHSVGDGANRLLRVPRRKSNEKS